MSTPSKRRRTSPTTYVTVGDPENDGEAQPKPTTPKRASYQSPTKASLARSNPKVLQQVAQAKERRESEPNRRQSSRGAALGGHPVVPEGYQENREQIAPAAGTTQDPSLPKEQTTNLVSDIKNTFKDHPSAQPILPESTRPIDQQQELSSTPRHINVPLPSFTSPSIVPRLVQSTGAPRQENRRSTSAELPPTPVALGSGTRPHRPRGLASSSPGGSGRRRVHGRNGHITSSPLKPKAPAPPVEKPEDELDHAEVASGIGDEQELGGPNAESGVETDEDTDDPTIRDKQQQLRSLQEELKATQEQYNKLKKISNAITQTKSNALTHTKLDGNLAFMLDWLPPPPDKNPSSPHLEDHPLFKKYTSTYLNLFTPGNLRISYEGWEETTTTRAPNKFVYQTTFAAPEPWPSSALNLTFDIITDQTTGEIVEITFAKSRDQPVALQGWIDGRLGSPVFETDLATIVTGVGRYFEEDVKRAGIYERLSERLASSGSVEQSDILLPIQSRKVALGLLPYLNTTQHTFASGSTQSRSRTRRSAGSAKQVMLTYDISLNWSGQASTSIDICASGFSNDVVDSARRLFRKVEGVDGVERAFEAVWGALGMEATSNAAGDVVGVVKGKGKGKRKVRRMTEFDSPVKL